MQVVSTHKSKYTSVIKHFLAGLLFHVESYDREESLININNDNRSMMRTQNRNQKPIQDIRLTTDPPPNSDYGVC